MNNLTLTAYDNTGGTLRTNSELSSAEAVRFSTYYPGGLYGDASFFLPRSVTTAWAVQYNDKIVIRNGLTTVYEGYVTNPAISLDEQRQGLDVQLTGFWGNVMMTRSWQKPWADARIDDNVWPWQTTSAGADKADVSRSSGNMRITAKEIGWTLEAADIRYDAPGTETIKRITGTLVLQESSQTWKAKIGAGPPFAELGSRISTGTTAFDYSVTNEDYVTFSLESLGTQTAYGGGTIYAEVRGVMVYTETGNINLPAVAADVRAHVPELSADESLIGTANTFNLAPLVSEVDTLADILTTAANMGDLSYNPWACGVRAAELASDNKPILFVEQQPALTDYEYAVRLNEPNIVAPFGAEPDVGEVRNWVAVQYNTADGRRVWVTPDDDANLKDATSIAQYGERHEWLTMDTTSLSLATNYGRRFLSQRKDPQWQISGGIGVVGYIRGKDGRRIPACEVQAGKRVKIENWLNDLSGTGLTFLITATDYDDTTEICNISVGRPNRLDTWLARTMMILDRKKR